MARPLPNHISEGLKTPMGNLGKQNNGISRFAPYGWDLRSGRGNDLREKEEEQGVLALMKGLRKDGKSFQAIAGALADSGYHPKRGVKWNKATEKRILDRTEPSEGRPLTRQCQGQS
jgi:hypothetical protein